MNQSPLEQRRMMWVYIILLLMVIVVLWLFFLKKEINLKIEENASPGLGGVLKEFKDSITQGGVYLKQAGVELRRLTRPADSTTPEQVNLSEEQKADLLKKIQEKLQESSATSTVNN